MEAVLGAGAATRLSHNFACEHLGLLPFQAGPPHVLSEVDGPSVRREFIRHRSATLRPQDTIVVRGVPCTSVARSLVDLASFGDVAMLEKAFDRAQLRRVLRIEEVESVLAATTRPRGAVALRRLLALHGACPLTRSELERRFLQVIRRARLPEPLVNLAVRLEGRKVVPDFRWPRHSLVVEVDGAKWHEGPVRSRADRRRDRRLYLLQGWTVLRYGWEEVVGEGALVASEVERGLEVAGRPQVAARRAM